MILSCLEKNVFIRDNYLFYYYGGETFQDTVIPVELRAQLEFWLLSVFLSFVANLMPVQLAMVSGRSPEKWLTRRL